MLETLDMAGIKYYKPQGAYYVLCDISEFGFESDVAFTQFLIEQVGVAVVPGSSFYADPKNGHHLIRFCYCKRPETLEAARERLVQLKSKLPAKV